MKKWIFKIAITVIVLGLILVLLFLIHRNSQSKGEITIQIIDENQTEILSKSFEIIDESFEDFLKRNFNVHIENGFLYKILYEGVGLNCPNNKDSYICIVHNGKYSTVGISRLQVNPGDIIQFIYVKI